MNTQKVLLGTVLVQPEFAPYVLPVLDISDFEPDMQPVFAALQGFWTSTGILETPCRFARDIRPSKPLLWAASMSIPPNA